MKPDLIRPPTQSSSQDEDQRALAELFQLLYERGCKIRRQQQANKASVLPQSTSTLMDGQGSTMDSAQ
jgi:hypothetical protein